ncbi:MAG: hypothetical protein E6R06_14015 [Mycobacterium sp.]|nr:MAG: hypothetical protein E6R06_14015 [Mycobacterium sp.]
MRPRAVEQRYPITANHLAQMRYRGTGPRFIRRGHLIIYRAVDIEQWLMGGMVETAEVVSP